MKLLKFAAIDIGTNAARLLFTNVIEENGYVSFRKSSLTRVPLRLGDDVFKYNEIKEQKIKNLTNTINGFKHLILAQEIVDFKACATSAMREAKNGKHIVKQIEKETGIHIEIIDGEKEAEYIHSYSADNITIKEDNYLFVDMGGGSTEITVYAKNMAVQSHSFKLGTIRILRNQSIENEFQSLKKWVKNTSKKFQPKIIIGSGGNINKLYKISETQIGKPFKQKRLNDIYDYLCSLSYEDRIKYLGLNPDRADVIIPAANLFLKVMKWSNIKQILVPKFGVADGIVKKLYENYKVNQKN